MVYVIIDVCGWISVARDFTFFSVFLLKWKFFFSQKLLDEITHLYT